MKIVAFFIIRAVKPIHRFLAWIDVRHKVSKYI